MVARLPFAGAGPLDFSNQRESRRRQHAAGVDRGRGQLGDRAQRGVRQSVLPAREILADPEDDRVEDGAQETDPPGFAP